MLGHDKILVRFQIFFRCFSANVFFRCIVISHYNTARVWKFDGRFSQKITKNVKRHLAGDISRIVVLIFVFDAYVISPLRLLDKVKISPEYLSIHFPSFVFVTRQGRIENATHLRVDSSSRDREVPGCTELLALSVFSGVGGNAFSFDSAVIVGECWCNCCCIFSRFFVEIKIIFFAFFIMLYFHDFVPTINCEQNRQYGADNIG